MTVLVQKIFRRQSKNFKISIPKNSSIEERITWNLSNKDVKCTYNKYLPKYMIFFKKYLMVR